MTVITYTICFTFKKLHQLFVVFNESLLPNVDTIWLFWIVTRSVFCAVPNTTYMLTCHLLFVWRCQPLELLSVFLTKMTQPFHNFKWFTTYLYKNNFYICFKNFLHFCVNHTWLCVTFSFSRCHPLELCQFSLQKWQWNTT